MSNKTNILQKLNKIMAELDYIQKDKRVSFGNTNYTYASERAIKEAVHPLLVQHGIMAIPSIKSEDYSETKTDSFDKAGTFIGQKVSRLSRVRLLITFYDIDSGESLEAEAVGYGDDPLDKSPYKAITGALKYIFTTIFVIPTGDDPEGGEDVQKGNTKPPAAAPQPIKKGATLNEATRAPGTDKKQPYEERLERALGSPNFTDGQRTVFRQKLKRAGTVQECADICADVEKQADPPAEGQLV